MCWLLQVLLDGAWAQQLGEQLLHLAVIPLFPGCHSLALCPPPTFLLLLLHA
jgi:hypothetical protein